MPAPSRQNKGKKKSRAPKQGAPKEGSYASSCRLVASTPSFFVGQASSGTGGITTDDSLVSMTGANVTDLTPFVIGGRVDGIAAYFQQYRVRRGAIRFHPWSTISGLTTTVTGSTTTPSFSLRDFAVMVFKDPLTRSTNYTYQSLLDSGGLAARTSQPFTLKLPKSDWLWTTLQNASPNIIDLRLVAFGCLQVAFRDTSTTASANYGNLTVDLDLDYRFPIKSTPPIGMYVASKATSPPRDREETKGENTVRPVSGTGSGWFSSK